MAYSFITLGQARAALRLQLGDPSAANPYWTDAELNGAIVESLRTWQALTGFTRDRTTLPISVSAGFYDLAASGILAAGLFDYNVTDFQVYQSITATLLEPTAVPYTGTDQFNQQQINDALTQARDQFLLDTGSVITSLFLANPAPPISRISLPQSVVDVRRAEWVASATGLYTILWRFDEYAAGAFLNSWQTPQLTPVGFSVSVTPPITLQVIPPSNDAVTTDTGILAVSSGAALTLSPAVPLGVADDLSYGVKYAALATLFGADGQDRDEQRAQYCEQRYAEAVTIARLNPSVLQAIFGSTILWTNSIFDEDAYNNSWRNQTPGPPQRIAFAGRNLVAPVPYPNGSYSITLDLVRNMPVPATDGAFLQIGNEKLNISAIPAVFIFGPDGKELKRFTLDDPNHLFTYDEVEKTVVALLEGKPLPSEKDEKKPAPK